MPVSFDAGWSSLVARRAHNPKVVGSNPAPATICLSDSPAYQQNLTFSIRLFTILLTAVIYHFPSQCITFFHVSLHLFPEIFSD